MLQTLDRLNVAECETVSTSMDISIDLRLETEPAINIPYQNLMDRLMFLAINTRTDILL